MVGETVVEATPLDSEVEESGGEGAVGIGPMEGEDIAVAEVPTAAIVTPETSAPAVAPNAEQPAPSPETSKPSPAPVAPLVDPMLRQYIGQLEAQQRVAQQQDELRFLATAIEGYAQALEEQQGFTPEQAQALAQREGQGLYAQYRAEQFRQGQINAAFAIGKQYNVDPRALMQLPTPQAMEEVAKRATERSANQARMKALEKEIADLKKAQVPAGQHWESGRPAPAAQGGRGALLDRYLENPDSLTPQQKASLFPNR